MTTTTTTTETEVTGTLMFCRQGMEGTNCTAPDCAGGGLTRMKRLYKTIGKLCVN